MTTILDKIEFDQVIERGCRIDIPKQVLVSTIQGKDIKKERENMMLSPNKSNNLEIG